MKLSISVRIAAAMAIGFAGSVSGAATTWDAATDFSTTTNPTGVWAYGTTGTSPGGTFTVYTQLSSDGEFTYWNDRNDVPIVGKAGATDWTGWNTVFLPVGTLNLHPGPGSTFASVQFTAPSSGSYKIDAAFWGADTKDTTTDAHISVSGVELYSANVTGFGVSSKKSWSGLVSLNQGNTLRFDVGDGGNSYGNDSTGFSATISAVPEPANIMLIVSGLALLAVSKFCRRKQK